MVLDALFGSGRWMIWNLFLALVPLGLSILLFRRPILPLVVWVLGVVVFVAFLPNAPYVLTDLIHLPGEMQDTPSRLINTIVILPKYLLFVLIGFEAYVLSLINVGYYLQERRLRHWIVPIELVLHGLSAIGVYLGRFERFNSWELVHHFPKIFRSMVENLANDRSLLFICLGFVGLSTLYWLFKQITLALLLQRRYLQALREYDTRTHLTGS